MSEKSFEYIDQDIDLNVESIPVQTFDQVDFVESSFSNTNSNYNLNNNFTTANTISPAMNHNHTNMNTYYNNNLNDNSKQNVRLIRINRQIQDVKYCSNSISTSKYNVITFLPKFLWEQFRKYSNMFFLIIVALQQFDGVSPTGRYTTLVPLTFILGVSAIKELIEDFKRRKSDRMLNNKKVNVFRSNGSFEPSWQVMKWRDVVVGDVVKIIANELFPADLLLLSSSEPNSICYIQTSNLDGETNLKIRQGLSKTSHLLDSQHLRDFDAEIVCELPNQRLYEFNGNLKTNQEEIPISPDQILLRGSQLQNTKWIYGAVIYTGHETRIMMNSSTPPFKRSEVEKITNTQILLLFIILLVLSLLSSIFSEVWSSHENKNDKHWYIGYAETDRRNFVNTFLTFFILYNNLIPISLQVTLELVKFLQAYFINWDEEMYDKENGFAAVARTSNLNEELGQIKYVFSDKTGTLTCNRMEFKQCSIAGVCYGSGNMEEFNGFELINNLERHETKEVIDEFLTLLSTCHTVIPEHKNGFTEIQYQASSPDETALVKAAQKLGIVFHTREPDRIKIKFFNTEREYELLNVLEFNSDRKRMSVILRDQSGTIKLYCKGADNVIVPRVSLHYADHRDYTDATIDHLECFAREGYRTLVLAYRVLKEEEYQQWKRIYHSAATSIYDRERKVQEAAELIEKNLIILGATAIEDKLQEGVADTITMLRKADIKVWVLTGDKIETAINIGYSSKLLTESTHLVYLVDHRPEKIKEIINREINILSKKKDKSLLGLIIEGKSLIYALADDCQENFLKLATSCATVICCRATPKNKAQIVDFIKTKTKSITLAIGDGANDVSMIQAAHVGVGIYGREGTQALSASDYAIGQFRFLAKLLFVHGIWNYKRLCKVILYSFYKNICLYVIELWFALSNGFSGQILFDRWLIGFYNVLFTAAPPMALGLFDRPSKASTMLRFPELYKITQNKSDFNITVFWTWMVNAFIHSIVLYFVCNGALSHDVADSTGKVGDYLFMGNFVYTYCVIIVCLKSGLETDSWTWITHLSIWGSIGFWFIFLIFYSFAWETVGIAPDMTRMAQNLFASPLFWIAMIFVPVFSLLPDIVYKVLQRTYFKTDEQIIQENELVNNDIEKVIRKSRLSETARLLRSAFSLSSVGPVRPYRGYAFSQEEHGVVTQTDLIRSYDSNKNKPSGN